MVNIDLASFSFDTSEILQGAAQIKKSIDEIKAEQKELTKSGDTSSEKFVENAADLRTLNGLYREHIKYLSDSSKGALDAATREAQLELVLNQEAVTIKELRDQNKQLNKLRNDTNLLTEEGQAELKLLNDQLDENNALIKENVDAYTQQKIGIGDYASGIKEALSEMNPFNTSITIFIQNAQEAGGVMPFLSKSLKGVTSGIIGMTKASLAFIATPVGAVIAVIAGAFLLVQNALNRSETATNKLAKAFAPLKGIFDGVLKLLEPLGDFIIDGLVKGFELLEVGVNNLIDSLSVVLDFLGFESAAQSVRDFSQAMNESADNAQRLVEAEAKLTEQQRQARIIQLEYQKDAERLRQIRDDETLSTKERIEANRQLGAVLDEQLRQELRIAEQALLVANLRIEAEGRTTEALDAQASALENIADIEERINGQRSEQLTNRVALEREAADKASEAADRRIQKANEELALLEQQQGWRKRTLQEDLDFSRFISDEKLNILNEQLKAQKISQEEYAREVLAIQQDLARQEAEIAVDTAGREIESYRRAFEQQQQERRFLSEQVLEDKTNELNALLEKEQQFAALQLEQGLINQQDYDDQIFELQEANRLAVAELNAEREAVEKEEALELRALEFEEELERLLEEGATKFEIEQAQEQEQFELRQIALDESLRNQEISQELYDSRLDQLNRERNAAELRNEKILAQEKLKIATGLLDAAASFIDKDSKAGKAISVAKAGINMYEGISAGLKLGYPAAIPAVALAAATGIKAIKDIVATKIPSASGSGSVGGGGGGFSTNLATNLSGQNVALDSSSNANVQDQIQNQADFSGMSEQIATAVQTGAEAGTMQGSQQGITDLSANQEIMNQSSF